MPYWTVGICNIATNYRKDDMDLDLYQQLFKKYWLVFVIIVLGSVGLVWGVSTAKAPAYEGSLLLSFNAKPEPLADPSQYQYGEFYSMQGSEFLVKNVAADLADPSSVEVIMSRAQLPLPEGSLERISRVFTLTPAGVTALSVGFEAGTEDDALRGLQAVQDVTQSHLAALQQKGLYPNIVMTAGQIFVRQQVLDVPLTLGLGAVLGISLGFFVLLVLSLTIPPKKA